MSKILMEPTELQQTIIEYDGNTVILASPGSGKTFVLSEKIKKVLRKESMLPYQGVLAISFTRKASANLKQRTLEDGTFPKNSVFGTIDSFCLKQIILPFGNYLFGYPQKDIVCIDFKDLPSDQQSKLLWINDFANYNSITNEQISLLSDLFRQGYVLIKSVELLALHLVLHCKACQKYIKARFKYVFIDEYQDIDTYFHSIFLSMLTLGCVGVVVGDVNQSIFGFAHKSSKYLKELNTSDNFKSFTLNKNFRCKLPIVNYSNRLLDPNYEVIDTTEKGVYLIRVQGDEKSIAKFIDAKINSICEKFTIEKLNTIAILAKNRKYTLRIINENLTTKHRIIEDTPLDNDLNPKSQLYIHLLRYFFDTTISFFSIVNNFIEYDNLSLYEKHCLIEQKNAIRALSEQPIDNLINPFKKISNILLPNIIEGDSINKLKEVLSNKTFYDSYKPINNDEIQLMTLHKAKGLEFDIVFHLNLCENELPHKTIRNQDWEQDLNLHYVGITRAKKVCYLIRGTQRTYKEMIFDAKDSEFLTLNGLPEMRNDYNLDANLNIIKG